MTKPRDKGARGERLAIELLQPIVDQITAELGKRPVLLQRNSIQSDGGGSDIVGLDWLAVEVKNVENETPGAFADWWEQTVTQAMLFPDAQGRPRLPILLYKRNGRPFRARMMGWAGGHHSEVGVPCLIDLAWSDFVHFFESRLRHELRFRA